MATTALPRVFELVEEVDGVTWVPKEARTSAKGRVPGAMGRPTLRGGAAASVLLYRTTSERQVERRKRARARALDVTA